MRLPINSRQARQNFGRGGPPGWFHRVEGQLGLGVPLRRLAFRQEGSVARVLVILEQT